MRRSNILKSLLQAGATFLFALGIWAFASDGSLASQGSRIKDLVAVRGVRSNQLIGYGIVVGLPGSGDTSKSLTTNRSVASMLTRLGINSSPAEFLGGSAAAIVASADLSTFSRNGDKIDIRISTIGDAKSLAGGTLLLTPLRAGDGEVYVVAQGAVVVGQATGAGASVLTVASVPGGGLVEREFAPTLAVDGSIDLNLHVPDFTTNTRIVDAINGKLKGFFAESIDPATVRIDIPPQLQDRLVEFIAEIESLTVVVDRRAVVAINERTGTIVLGQDVSIGAVSIAHGDLSISVGSGNKKSTKQNALVTVPGTTIGELVNSLNTLGAKPKDLVSIIQAMHAAGALSADLKFL